MSEFEINGITLSMSGTQTLPLSVVRRGSPKYNAQSNFFSISLNNNSGSDKYIPFDEISRNTVLVYRNTSTKAEIVDNKVPPPREEGIVEKLSSGEMKNYLVVFEYPQSIASFDNKVANLQFCVKWESNWLRISSYSPKAFDWNESFELCHEIQIIDDVSQG